MFLFDRFLKDVFSWLYLRIENFIDRLYHLYRVEYKELGLQIDRFINRLCRLFTKEIKISNFMDGLYQLFKKDMQSWNESDKFLTKAVSDFLSLAIKKLIERTQIKNVCNSELHYAFIVPFEWEEEIREDLIRPIFIQAGLISKDDHKDRLLFISDLESVFYSDYSQVLERGLNIITVIPTFIDRSRSLVELNLIKTSNTLFDFSDSVFFPKVMKSNSFYITSDSIKKCIKAFLTTKLFIDKNDIQEIAKDIYNYVNIKEVITLQITD